MRILVVSNRLPHVVKITGKQIKFLPSTGGLAKSISSLFPAVSDDGIKREYIWAGWPGITVPEGKKSFVKDSLAERNCLPVFLSRKLQDEYYDGMCNGIIWPLFHYFPEKCEFVEQFYEAYRKANEIFAGELKSEVKKADIVLIQDYHLFLLPGLLRKIKPDVSIGFFLHIPFPSFEMFRLMPKLWRREILEGILGADVIGFHTYEYARYFGHSVLRVLGLEQKLDRIYFHNRPVNVKSIPLGIDVRRFAPVSKPESPAKSRRGTPANLVNRKIILSVDRLDYTKGIDNRLAGFELFLKRYRQFHRKVSLIMLTIPSRTDVGEYQIMKNKIDGLVGRINGNFGNIDWTPVTYLYKPLTSKKLVDLYRRSSVALVTPLRDGMNLVAKEFVASHKGSGGVLILSEMAGSSHELVESVLINPYSIGEIADGIHTALVMPPEEQVSRMRAMQNRIEKNGVGRWLKEFIKSLGEVRLSGRQMRTNYLNDERLKEIVNDFNDAAKRLLILDFDGTLVPHLENPEMVFPPAGLLNLLKKYTSGYKNHIVILSGRDKTYLEKWFGKLRATLVAEHGCWIKEEGARWKMTAPLTDSWKGIIKEIMEKHTELLPGSFVEEKDFSIAFHYRKADPILSSNVVFALFEELTHMTTNQEISILSGDKALEVVSANANKGMISELILKREHFDFVLGIGNDTTDESMFSVVNRFGITIKVGQGPSFARYNLEDHRKAIGLLKYLNTGNKKVSGREFTSGVVSHNPASIVIS